MIKSFMSEVVLTLVSMRSKTYEKCTLEDCDRPHRARGLCRLHYQRWLSTGDPHVVKGAVLWSEVQPPSKRRAAT